VVNIRRIRWLGNVAHTGGMRNAHKIYFENLKGGDQLENLSVYGRIILEWILRIRLESVSWIPLAQDTDQWWALMNTVMKFRVP
jgi:hypothetical protein